MRVRWSGLLRLADFVAKDDSPNAMFPDGNKLDCGCIAIGLQHERGCLSKVVQVPALRM